MTKYFYSIFLLLSFTFAAAQTIEIPISIDWDYNKVDDKYYLGGNTQYLHNDTLYIVLSENSFRVKPNFSIVDFNFLNIEMNSMPDSISVGKNYLPTISWLHGRDGWVAIIKSTPLVKVNGSIVLLSSFKLVSNANKTETNNNISLSKTDNDFNFSTESVLKNGSWVKLSINKTGVYKIDNTMMGDIASKLGVSLSSINPQKIAIYGQGGGLLPELNSEYNSDDLREFPIDIVGENDGSFDSDDYIIFYTEGSSIWEDKIRNSALHVNNIYDNHNYIFVTIKNENGKRINASSKITEPYTEYYNDYISRESHEVDENNFIESGQQWFGERFENKPQQTFSFSFPNRDVTKNVTINTRIGAHPLSSSELQVSANGIDLDTYNFSRTNGYGVARKIETIVSSNKDIDVDFSFTHGGEGECMLDYIEVIATSKLIFENSQFQFHNPKASADGGVSEYRISNTNNLKYIWKVTDPTNPQLIPLTTNTGYKSFKENSNNIEYYQLIAEDDYYTPGVLETVENQNLHGHTSVDYIIITHDDFKNSANKLAEFHRGNGLSVQVVDVNKIYNEFSSGRQDLIAIRQYVRMIYKRGGASKLKYLLMFGDASYDFKDRIDNNTNFVPGYQSYYSASKLSSFISDDYFGFMDNEEGNNINNDLLDIAVGRIPIMTDEEGIGVVDKIIGYNTYETLGDWRNKIQFLSDDITNDKWEAQLIEDSEKLSELLSTRNSEYNHQKIYLDSYKIQKTSGGNTYPDAHVDFMQNVQNGNLVTNFFGHGSEVSWTGEGLFGIDDIENLQNLTNLPLFVTVTCEFSRYDNPAKYTGGEKLMIYKDGGSIGLISTTREITVTFGGRINDAILSFLLPAKTDEHLSIGEVLRKTKNLFPAYLSRRTVSLIGDPALKLAYPKKNIVVTSIEKINYGESVATDTISSLMKVRINGEIMNNGSKDVNFNGTAFPLMYDKKVHLESLDNNNFGIKTPYWMQNNIIYKGKSTIVDGEFVMEFVIPKDINYAYGNGKLSLYALSDEVGVVNDASGDNSDLIVGGIDITSSVDDEGPVMNNYINNKYFVDGGITNSNPLIIIDLEDESGINTVGNGIGHNLIMTLKSEEINEEIILNEFYESENDNYKKGKISYQLLALKPGNYTAESVAWDVFNNSSISTINFTVKNDDDVVLENLKNYPNPFSSTTNFRFSHNYPNKELTTRIEIFSITGLLVKTINHSNNYDGFVVNDIVWTGDSDSGTPLPSGTYIYKVSTISEEGNTSNQEANKLMIIR